jgi:hypothetical protein
MLASRPHLAPARMVNGYVYHSRLSFLEWVDSPRASNADVAEQVQRYQWADATGGAALCQVRRSCEQPTNAVTV